MTKIGRNSPCPCGSGKKYKQCCVGSNMVPIGIASDGAADEPISNIELPPQLQEMFPGLQEQLAGQPLDELNQLFAQSVEARDTRSEDDFHGLSPEKMHGILYTPLEGAPWYELLGELPADLSCAPILQVFVWLAEGLGEQGLKTTATGNLPRKVCIAVHEAYKAQFLQEGSFPYHRKVWKEEDFWLLHIVRLIATSTGLIRKHKGHFVVTNKAKAFLDAHDHAGLYRLLFVNYVSDYNWDYGSRWGDSSFVQQSWLFSLYLLSLYGDQERLAKQYSQWFQQAFPMVLEEIPHSEYYTQEEQLERLYEYNVLTGFAIDLGLITVRDEARAVGVRSKSHIRKTPLLDAVVKFK